MSTDKPFRAWKPGVFATAHMPSWRGKKGETAERRDRGDDFSTFSERVKWERATKPKIFAPSEEPPLGRLLSVLRPDDTHEKLSSLSSESVITNCRTVASFNWLDTAEPAIVIPGKPPRWTPLTEPRRLKPDDGEYFRDYNAARYPDHPLEPAVIAALALQADIAQDVDIIACGKTLDQLLDFVQGTDKTFRMLVEFIDGNIFLVRRENTPRERLSDVQGYGHSFPEAYTTWDVEVKASTQHQRVILYHFGGLRLLVRSQGDGYLFDESNGRKDNICEASAPADLDLKEAVGVLSTELAESRVASITPSTESGQLRVTYSGDLIEQDRIFELKTRSVRRKSGLSFEATFQDNLSRLWVSQTPNFILAYHDHGIFEEINVINVQRDIKKWENDQAAVLWQFAALLHHIFEMAKSRPDGRLELRHMVPGELEVREQLSDAGDALSQPVRAMWARSKKHVDGEGLAVGDDDNDTSERAELDKLEGLTLEEWEDDAEPDYTACSAHDCGYCGRCSY